MMKFLKRNILTLALFLLLASVASPGWAKYTNCASTQLPTTFSLPNVGVLSNLPLGQPIAGAVVHITVPITCSAYSFTAGSSWRITGPSPATTAYANVYTSAGMPSGIGYQIRNNSGVLVTESSGSFTVSSTAPNTGITLNFSIELVKLTNTIATGSATLKFYPNVYDQQFANGTEASSNISFSMTIQRPSIPTCNPTLSMTQVTLPKVLVQDFRGMNTVAGKKPFSIGLNCEANAAPSVTFSDSTYPANASSVISLTGGSTASGIALQMLSNGIPVMLSPGGQAIGGSTVIVPTPSSNAHTVSIPLEAQYIQTTTRITAGSVNGIATFSLTYK